MSLYAASFIGRRKNALGSTYRIHDQVEGENPDAARLALYDRYEHISQLQLTPVEPPTIPQREAFDGTSPLDPQGFFATREAALTRVGCLIATGEYTLEPHLGYVWLHPNPDGDHTSGSIHASSREQVIELYATLEGQARGYDWARGRT